MGTKAGRGAPAATARESDHSRLRSYEALVGPGGARRADVYIAEYLKVATRSQLKARSALIEVDGKIAKPSRPLVEGERLLVSWTEEPSPSLVAEDIPLDILYEDDRVIVVNKAQGMVTHPGAGNRRGTLANAVLGRLAAPAGPDATGHAANNEVGVATAALRGGIVHRLDKDTSGVIIVAKDAEAQSYLSSQFRDRTTRKEYLAVTTGIPRVGSGTVGGGWNRRESRLGRDRRDRKRFAEVVEGGRLAVTDWRVLSTYGEYALVLLHPRTGRTHQLRVHLAALGSPILGDPIYGARSRRGGEGSAASQATLMLHAWKLAIRLPGHDEASSFVAPIPRRFPLILHRLERRFGKTKPPRS
ncbi:MAG TPA: RluA family pseudouridine synthase [Rectinemataceae bacterium]|nr:RluA family pseudouridine synthase [Rectinemataceae bacterium]